MEPHLSPNLIGAYNDGVAKVRGIVCNTLRANISDTIHDRMGESYDSGSLTTEVLIRLLEHEEKFETMKMLENWVETTTINVCRDEKKIMKNRLSNAHKVNALLVSIQSRNKENIKNIRICQRLHDLAMQHLPPKNRQVYYLSYVENLSVKQVAEKMQIGESTVKNHRSYALHKLRIVFADEQACMITKTFLLFLIPLLILYVFLQKLLS